MPHTSSSCRPTLGTNQQQLHNLPKFLQVEATLISVYIDNKVIIFGKRAFMLAIYCHNNVLS